MKKFQVAKFRDYKHIYPYNLFIFSIMYQYDLHVQALRGSMALLLEIVLMKIVEASG